MKPLPLLLLPLKAIADRHTKIFGFIFGAGCGLKALTMEEIVCFSTVTLAFCDFQHSALFWMESHLPLGFEDQSFRADRSCNLMDSPSFLVWRYKSASSTNKLACEDLHTDGRALM